MGNLTHWSIPGQCGSLGKGGMYKTLWCIPTLPLLLRTIIHKIHTLRHIVQAFPFTVMIHIYLGHQLSYQDRECSLVNWGTGVGGGWGVVCSTRFPFCPIQWNTPSWMCFDVRIIGLTTSGVIEPKGIPKSQWSPTFHSRSMFRWHILSNWKTKGIPMDFCYAFHFFWTWILQYPGSQCILHTKYVWKIRKYVTGHLFFYAT